MGIAEKFRSLTTRAQDAAVEHEDQIHQAVEKAELAADQRTGGQYHDQITKAGAKADAYVEHLKPTEPMPPGGESPRQTHNQSE